jgi:[ribosomal protein S18]-alanine N-acetyltransferase
VSSSSRGDGRSDASPVARDATAADLAVVVSWIGSRRECELWAGPRVTYPPRPDLLKDEIDWDAAIDLALDDARGLAGFGQLVPRAPDRVHLARVVVRPDARGLGLGRALCSALLDRAAVAGFASATLNVYRENIAAVRLYTDLGFRDAGSPRGGAFPDDVVAMRCSLAGLCRAGRCCEEAPASGARGA